MYEEPVTTQAAAATLAASKCQSCSACYICLSAPWGPTLDVAHVTSLWGLL